MDTRTSPNIVFIMADDMGYGDVGCYNPDSKIPTPNMDKLAEEGICFTDAHSPSAVCTPTRYGVLTGRYCWRSRLKYGVLYGYEPPLIEPERLTVAGLLKDAWGIIQRVSASGIWGSDSRRCRDMITISMRRCRGVMPNANWKNISTLVHR